MTDAGNLIDWWVEHLPEDNDLYVLFIQRNKETGSAEFGYIGLSKLVKLCLDLSAQAQPSNEFSEEQIGQITAELKKRGLGTVAEFFREERDPNL